MSKKLSAIEFTPAEIAGLQRFLSGAKISELPSLYVVEIYSGFKKIDAAWKAQLDNPGGCGMSTVEHAMDSAIMHAWTLAIRRGASPVEILRNVQRLETDEPRDCLPRNYRGEVLGAPVMTRERIR